MLNQIVLMGRLVADPEIRTTPSGVSVAKIRIAIDRDYQKQGEEKKTDFIPCTAWRQTADFLGKYFHKGSMIAVTGSLQSQSYEDKNTGAKRTMYDVQIDRVSFCGSKAETGAGYSDGGNNTASYQSGSSADFDTVAVDDSDLPF